MRAASEWGATRSEYSITDHSRGARPSLKEKPDGFTPSGFDCVGNQTLRVGEPLHDLPRLILLPSQVFRMILDFEHQAVIAFHCVLSVWVVSGKRTEQL